MENNPLERLRSGNRCEPSIQRSLVLDSNADFLRHFRENKDIGVKRVIERAVKGLKSNEILLGFSERDCKGYPVTMPIYLYSEKKEQSTKTLISGGQAGCGKTTLGLTIAEQYNYRMNYNVVLFDAKPEAQTRKQPQDDPKLHSMLVKINEMFPSIRPRAWNNMLSVKPMFADRHEPFDGEQIRYDFNDLDFQDILTLFGISSKNTSDWEMMDKIDALVHGKTTTSIINDNSGDGILSYQDVGRIIDAGGMKVDAVIKRRLKNLVDNKVIGASTDFDIVERLNNGWSVQYQTRIINARNPIPESLAYMANEIRNVSRGRYAARRPEESMRSERLRRPVMLYFTEFQTIYPRDPFWPSSKFEINSVYETKRAYGIDVVADSTSLREIHYVGIKQSDYLLTFRLDGSNAEYLRKLKNLGYTQLDQITALEEDKDNPPFQCAKIKPSLGLEEPLETFYPLPPMGSLHNENIE